MYYIFISLSVLLCFLIPFGLKWDLKRTPERNKENVVMRTLTFFFYFFIFIISGFIFFLSLSPMFYARLFGVLLIVAYLYSGYKCYKIIR